MQQRQLLIILLIVFLGTVGMSMPYLIFPPLFLHPETTLFAANTSEWTRGALLGITLAAYPLGQFIGSPIIGTLSDDFGRKGVLVITLFLSGLFCLVSAIALGMQIIWLLIGSRFMMGLMEGNIAIARAMAADLKQIDKHKSFGRINAAASSAYLVGPLVGGLMADQLTLTLPFYLTAGIFVLLAGISYWGVQRRPPTVKRVPKSFFERINFPKRLKVLMKNRALAKFLILSTLFTLSVDIFYEFGPVYLAADWDFSASMLSLYNGGLCVCLVAAHTYLTQRSATYPAEKVLKLAFLLFALLLLGTILFAPHTLFFFYAIIGLAIGVATTTLTVQISNSASEAIQGEVMGVQLALRLLGDALICLVGGMLVGLSPSLILLFAAALAATLVLRRY